MYESANGRFALPVPLHAIYTMLLIMNAATVDGAVDELSIAKRSLGIVSPSAIVYMFEKLPL